MTEPPAGLSVPGWETFEGLDRKGLVVRYRDAIGVFDPRVFELEAEHSERGFGADDGVGRWSCRALLNHLADAEMMFTQRIRRALAEDSPVLADWDHDAFMSSPLYGSGGEGASNPFAPIMTPMGALAATIHTLRLWTASVLFQLDDPAWERAALHPERGPLTVDNLVRTACWHVEHHGVFLNAKVALMLGPPTKPEPCDDVPSGGCGEGCGCVDG